MDHAPCAAMRHAPSSHAMHHACMDHAPCAAMRHAPSSHAMHPTSMQHAPPYAVPRSPMQCTLIHMRQSPILPSTAPPPPCTMRRHAPCASLPCNAAHTHTPCAAMLSQT
eukprot:359638-Chlamydomonas_euryale.AAC.1